MFQWLQAKRTLIGGVVLWYVLLGCGKEAPPPPEPDVIMLTELGEVHIQLFDATPIHKANFLKLCESGFYDSMAFHRVIYDFMVQIGDPRTRGSFPVTNADAPDGPGYTLPAEFVDTLAHLPGTIGAARKQDYENPEKRSAGSQFYIVTGQKVQRKFLDSMEVVKSGIERGNLFQEFLTAKDSNAYSNTFETYLTEHKFKDFRYPSKTRNQYIQKGGAPWLDFQYTIFGRVIQGMEIIQKVEVTPTNEYNYPKKPIRILQMKITNNNS